MATLADPWTLTARWVFPVDRPPLERGLVVTQGDKISAVEPHGTRTADIDLGNVALLPGLVNPHTHLDLSGLRSKCPPTPDFTEWLRGVIRYRRGQSAAQVKADIQTGLAESEAFGTTLLGDISADGSCWEILADKLMRSVVFHELLGLTKERAIHALKAASPWFVKAQKESSHRRPGLSPHAPFSFRADYLPDVSKGGELIAIHLAECAAELELLERQSGPFVPFLAELGVWDPTGLARDPVHIVQFTSSAKVALYVHGNYLRPEAPIPPHSSIIYCPRTHAAFGHPPHPFREFLARGVRVALGTDSLASNPDLDILAEARFVHGKHPDVAGATLLRMITLSGAEALGWADETGSLAPGKSADLVVLPLPDEDRSDPHLLALESDRRVAKTLFRGEWRQSHQPDA